MALVHSATSPSISFTSSAPTMPTLPFHPSDSMDTTTTMALLQRPPSSPAASRPPHRQIHRNRASYSCHSCRRRKVKCDRQHPTCGNCQKMAEGCVYSDNTGKGAKNKNKNRHDANAAHSSASSSASPDATECPGSPPKRQRTNSGTSISVPSEEDASSYRSHSRSSSLNQSEFGGLNSPFPSPDPTLVPPSSLPPPGSLLSKEGELETRVNRLAEIVDQWYKVAYSHSQPGSPPNGFNPEPVAPGLRRWPVPPALQLPEHPRPQSLEISGQLTPNASPLLGRESSSKAPSAARIRTTTVSSTHFASCKDGGEDVAMGHLSIQENGRSRYVGTSFWALLSNEVR
jgi:ribosomal protein L37AE/L43A